MTIYHKHHIIPKHMGGSDDPSNLIKLTIEDHAKAHLKLYEEHGRYQDLMAWKGLSGIIPKQELVRELQSRASKERHARHLRNGTHNWVGETNPSVKLVREGKHHFQQNIGNRPADIAQRALVANGNHHWQSEQHKLNVSKRIKKLALDGKVPIGTKSTCPHCKKIGQTTAMKRWHFDNCKAISAS